MQTQSVNQDIDTFSIYIRYLPKCGSRVVINIWWELIFVILILAVLPGIVQPTNNLSHIIYQIDVQ